MTDSKATPELLEAAMTAVCDCIAIGYPDADNAGDGENMMLFHGIGPTGTGGHITLNIKEIVEAVWSVSQPRFSSANAENERLRGAAHDAQTWLEALVQEAEPGSEESTHEVIKTITKLRAALSNTTPSPDPRDAVITELVRALNNQVRNCPVCKGEGVAVNVMDILSYDGPHEKTPCTRCTEHRKLVERHSLAKQGGANG